MAEARRPLRVLFISPFCVEKCGEAEFGRIWCRELRKLGVDMVEWDGCWPTVYNRGTGHQYMPDDIDTPGAYDLVHVNWGPANLGHYQPQHFPAHLPLSIYLCDIPPWSTTTLHPLAQERGVVFASEEVPGAVNLKHRAQSYDGPWPDPAVFREALRAGEVVVGIGGGVRGDSGSGLVIELAKKRGWRVSLPGEGSPSGWLSTEQEIARLASCTFNACWYMSTGRNVSMGATFLLAARRPMLLSSSSMFSYLWPYAGEIYISKDAEDDEKLEVWCDTILEGIALGGEKRPGGRRWAFGERSVLDELSWPLAARRIKVEWEAAVERRRRA